MGDRERVTASVVVPTKDAAATIAACVRSCLDQERVPVEVIVIDNASTDGTAEIARSLDCRVLTVGPERSAQRNAGARAARGEWLLFLDADMVLEPGVVASCLAACERKGAAACVVPERATGEGFWAECRALEKEVYLGDPDVEAARFFRRDAFVAHGGYDETIHGGGEDWDLPARVAAAGDRIARADAVAMHLEGRLRLRDAARKKFYYGRTLGRYVGKHPRLAARQLFRRAFVRRWRLLAADPVHAAGLALLKAVDLTAGVAGMATAAAGGEHPVERRAARPDVLILSLGFRPNIGGLETHLDDLVEYCTAGGRRVLVATLQPFTTPVSAPARERRDLLEVRRYRWFGRGWFFRAARVPALGFLYAFPAMLRVSAAVRGARPRVVYAQGLAAGAAAALVFPRARHVIGIHSDLSFRGAAGRAAGSILRRFDAVLCISERIRRQCIALGVRPERARVFRYWVDLERFSPRPREEAREHLGLDGFVALLVGRLIAEKGVAVALDAERRASSVTFVFAGAGPEETAVRDAISAGRSVRFLGAVAADELAGVYSAADALVVPSTSDEGFGRVIIEALACGTPVVASARGGIPEAITPEVGVLVEPRPAPLAEAIELLRGDPIRLEKMRSAARALAEERYSAANAHIIEEMLWPS